MGMVNTIYFYYSKAGSLQDRGRKNKSLGSR